MADEPKKCKHPACRCNAKEGSDYCSGYCEGRGKSTDITCECGHTGCDINKT